MNKPPKPCDTPQECFCLYNPNHKKCKDVTSVSIESMGLSLCIVIGIIIYAYFTKFKQKSNTT